jgi:hypothetical protein
MRSSNQVCSSIWVFAKLLEGSQMSARMHTGSNLGLANFVAEQRTSGSLEKLRLRA